MLTKGINSPLTSSAGRLFDAVASITGLRQVLRFEGQAAMELEFALEGFETDESYIIEFVKPDDSRGNVPGILDWGPMLEEMKDDIRRRMPVGVISTKFHNSLAGSIAAVARHFNIERVVLSGGCFQNKYLVERSIFLLREKDRQPYWHQRIPPNDGGIALGQIIAASRELAKE